MSANGCMCICAWVRGRESERTVAKVEFELLKHVLLLVGVTHNKDLNFPVAVDKPKVTGVSAK